MDNLPLNLPSKAKYLIWPAKDVTIYLGKPTRVYVLGANLLK
jgi:hypothetical protein